MVIDPRAEIVLRYVDVFVGVPPVKLVRVWAPDPVPGQFFVDPATHRIILGGKPEWPLIATLGGIRLRDLMIAIEPTGAVTLVLERFPPPDQPAIPKEPA